jgi:hypothetical protein
VIGIEPRPVDGIEQTEMTKQFSSAPWQRLGQTPLTRVVVHQHNRAAPLGEQRGRGRAGRTAADDDRIDLCVIARLHDPRPAPGSPVSSAFQIGEGSSRGSSSRARATKPLALATAKLMPFKLRSRGTFGISRGYPDVAIARRPRCVMRRYSSLGHLQSSAAGITHRYQVAMAAGRVIVLDGSSMVEEGARI